MTAVLSTDQDEFNFKNKSLEKLDEEGITSSHWWLILTAGMGFFTDAYDLFVIGIVTTLLMPVWHLSISQIALLNGASLISAAMGAIVFGLFSSKFGRKKMYGIEVLILFIGAILSALSFSYIWLLVTRMLVGFGIGGDYPSSAVVVSENANRKNRGFLVLLVFAMQALGLIIGPLLASLLLSLHLQPELIWRLLLGFGAIPAASVFYLRRTISESPHYLLTKQTPVEVSRAVSELTGYQEHLLDGKGFRKQKLTSKKWMKCLIGTAGAWFLLDVVFYGNGVSSTLIMNSILPNASLLKHTLLSVFIFLCFAAPGYFFAAKYVDRIGRKSLQIGGFLVMAICYLLIGLIPDILNTLPIFIAIFGLSFFFVNFGPNTTTFLIPSEIYPTNIRATAHGISAATGKIGAFIGAFALPLVLKAFGLPFTMGIIGIISLLGILISLLVPEMKGMALESSEIIE